MNSYEDANKIINKAFELHSKGNILEAAKYYQSFINKGFKDQRVFSNYGVILQDLGKLKEAETSTRKAIEINPDYEKAHLNLGIILKQLGKLSEAETSTRKAIEINPDYEKAHLNLGEILKDLGKLEEAETSTRKAIQLNPKFADAHSNLGIILEQLGKLSEAELSYRKAIEINPDFAEAHYNLGNLLKELGKLSEAELSYRKAIEINPDFAEAHYNLGNLLKELGKLSEAELSCRKAIELDPNSANAHCNLGGILKDLPKLEEAELSCRKAIEINPNFAGAHYNLGIILMDLGILEEAEISLRKTIELNSNFAKAYYSLSVIKYSDQNKIWQDQLFSENILNNKLTKEKIDLYFARANILHKEKNHKDSAKYLKLANDLKLAINPSNLSAIINKSKQLRIESDKKEINQKEHANFPESIFIVGMPRSGSTLLESILSMRNDVYDLGEIDFLEESFFESNKSKKEINFAKLYWKKLNNKTKLNITTNKNLFNYQFTGIISKKIPNSKIIHCLRNPLDNILSIYRTNFAKGNEYSSSLIDSAKVYLDQDEIMNQYKKRFRSNIYDLNYDLLVQNPNKEIKTLISWLGWDWHDQYLSPHLNPRSVSTASNIQVRSQINSKSIGGWKNYKEMLKPAMEIIIQKDKYKDLKY